MSNIDKTVGELLARFPHGFAISASGTIGRTITGSSHISAIINRWPIPPNGGGYLVVDSDDDHCSECGRLIGMCKCHER